jgi:hypothetical protein
MMGLRIGSMTVGNVRVWCGVKGLGYSVLLHRVRAPRVRDRLDRGIEIAEIAAS